MLFCSSGGTEITIIAVYADYLIMITKNPENYEMKTISIAEKFQWKILENSTIA